MIRGEDLKRLRTWINTYFKVYDVRWDIESAAFFCDLDPNTLETDFNSLRKELLTKGYIPMLLFEGGEHIVYVTEKAPARYKPVKVNLILLIATICTTVFVGAINWWSYDGNMDQNDFWQILTPAALGNGALYFAFPLMLILGIHESGHYFMARYHGVAASLPFFIPVPIPPLGTFGAFISMREPIPDKKALLDIGVAGPIAGFCVAVPVTIIGFMLTDIFQMPVPDDAGGLIYLGTSFFYNTLAQLVPTNSEYLTHPTALAGWVGLLVTFLNLLPAGQLDGGHVARAMFGDNAKYFSYASIGVMIFLAFYFQYLSWILFVFIIVFLGVSHPPPLNDITKLDAKRWVTGAVVFVIFFGCFTPVPLYPAEIDHDGAMEIPVDTINLGPNETGNVTISVKNVGNVDDKFTLKVETPENLSTLGWDAAFDLKKGKKVKWVPTIGPGKTKNVTLEITGAANGTPGDTAFFNLTLKWKDDSGKSHTKKGKVFAIIGLVTTEMEDEVVESLPGRSDPHNLTITYLGTGNKTLTMEETVPPGWGIEYSQEVVAFTSISGYMADMTFRVLIPDHEPVSSHEIVLSAVNVDGQNRTYYNVTVLVRVLQVVELDLDIDRPDLIMGAGENRTVNITVTNLGNGKDVIEVEVDPNGNFSFLPPSRELTLDAGASTTFGLVITALVDPGVNGTHNDNLVVMAHSKMDPGVLEMARIRVSVEG
jgi:membrane-associated protease RseP (regulator of RpoE activity)